MVRNGTDEYALVPVSSSRICMLFSKCTNRWCHDLFPTTALDTNSSRSRARMWGYACFGVFSPHGRAHRASTIYWYHVYSSIDDLRDGVDADLIPECAICMHFFLFYLTNMHNPFDPFEVQRSLVPRFEFHRRPPISTDVIV